jgi:tetratricopeptide (TPR) repeat protein
MHVAENNPPSYAGLGIGARSIHEMQRDNPKVPTYYLKHTFDGRLFFEKEWIHGSQSTKQPNSQDKSYLILVPYSFMLNLLIYLVKHTIVISCALINKGSALADLGSYSEAIEHFDKVLALDPSNVLAAENKELAESNVSTESVSIRTFVIDI